MLREWGLTNAVLSAHARGESAAAGTYAIGPIRCIPDGVQDAGRGHVLCGCLALTLRVALRTRPDANGWGIEWQEAFRDSGRLQEGAITAQGKGYVIRAQNRREVTR